MAAANGHVDILKYLKTVICEEMKKEDDFNKLINQ